MKLDALLFDVDGTLVDTEELHRQAYNQTFLDFGFGWEWGVDLYASLLEVSGGEARVAHYIDLIELPAAEKIRLRRVVPAIHREKTRLYGELIVGNLVRPRPGVARLIDEARHAGLRVGLAASSASANVRGLVSAALGHESLKAVGAIVCADEVTRKKPAPDIYELLLTLLRVPASTCVTFEDSANGVLSAKAAGLYTVATPTRWTMTQKFDRADLLVLTLGDPTHPLEPSIAARVGAPYLGLAQLESLRYAAGPALRLHEGGS
jgi:HAD superfamily hydrolase (TIGR01509 family)